ncbi:MAG: aminotransferase class III-fold pyridoxal phosphate-dependent enzyme, partial [Acidobacteria bacterium]|nr:aminotransferase class III-fold pyridoxal phosphate-dependent enzyme [Acidobacteriota bacterium]
MKRNVIKTAFIFPGFGSQWKGMGAGLLSDTIFREKIRECDKEWHRYVNWSIEEEIRKPAVESKMENTIIGFPCALAIEIALIELLKNKGITPDGVIGHSGGELAAAYTAGMLNLTDLFKVINIICLEMEEGTKAGDYIMAHISLPVQEVEKAILARKEENRIFISAVNGPKATIITGVGEAIRHLVDSFLKQNIFCRFINSLGPFHCPIIERHRNVIWEGIKDIKPGHAALPIYSSLLGGLANENSFDAYFWTEMMIKPVQFTAGITALLNDGYTTFVEVSPHAILARNIQEILEANGKKDCLVIGTLKKEADDKEELLHCLSILKRGQAKNEEEEEERKEEKRKNEGKRGQAKKQVEIAHELDAAIREVLNRDTGDIDSYLGFFDMGFNSLTALKLKDSLAQRLGLSLPTTLIFDYPDMASLKKYLLSFFTDHNDNMNIKKNSTGQIEKNEPVAITGMACRFPGGANNLEAFWDLLQDGRDTVSEIPSDRWDGNAYYAEKLSPGKSITKRGNFISNIDVAGFDASFFKISPKEAESIDPQHRLLLEVAVEALENAGIPLENIRDKAVGVFTGMCMDDYKIAHVHAGNLNQIDAYSGSGSMFCSASGRISYFLGTRGPAMVVDTACSSTLTAIHLAVQALRSGECEMALAGGVNLLLAPNMFVYLSQLQTLSVDGTCKTFAETADGYGRGEGCGVLVLKRLSDALRDSDRVLALIKGTAVNHDGASTGFTAPNGVAQQEVIYKALENARMEPGSVDYVEAHGAGTPLGDPIEIRAIHEVYGKTHTNDNPLWVGTVKTNIGHLEGAAGAAAVIKMVLSLQHEMLPAHLHVSQPNPLIEWKRMPVKINMNLTPWTRSEKPRRAGINGFGFTGTNAHIIIEETPLPRENAKREFHYPYFLYMLNFSAKNEWALKTLGELYKDFFKRMSANAEDLPHICYTSAVGRSQYRFRFSAIGKNREEIERKLSTFLADPQGKGSKYANLDQMKTGQQVVFLFTGQGSQYIGMARELFESNRVFKLELETCDGLFRELGSASIIELLYGASAENDLISEAIHAQPVIFSIEYSLAKLWLSWGVKPALVMGHSIGEYAAACIAGVFTLEDAVKLVSIRGQLMQSVKEPGQMVGILASEEKIRPLLDEDVSIAAVNAPDNVTISGRREAVANVVAKIKQQKIFIEPLVISHAFHSVMMEPYVEKFQDKIAEIVFSTPQLPVISTITAKHVENEMCDPTYWGRHICRTVRFYDCIRLAWEQGHRTYLEIGGTATLAGLAGQCLNDEKCFFLPSLRKGKHAYEQILTSLSQLYLRGMTIHWDQFYRQTGMELKKVLLPNYPFQRERYWRNLITSSNTNVALPPSPQMIQMTQMPQTLQTEVVKTAEIPGPKTMTSIYPALKEMIQTVSGLDPESIADDADLISLGLDSLMLVELRRKINGQFGVDITLNEFFMTLNTLTKIADQIKSKFLPGLPVFPVTQISPVPVPNYAGYPATPSPTPTITAPKPLNFSARANVSQRGLTEQQRRHLDALIQRYTERTKTSKQQTQTYRDVLADSKATVGFNPSIKEMLYPLVGKRSQGSRIWDIDGNEYIDVTMGFGVYLFGHHPAFLKNVFQELIADDIELGPRSYLVGEVASMIAKFTGMERVTFTNTGTEAVMAAIRIARAATGRTKIVMFSRSYHGHSDGTLAVSSSRDGKLISEPVSAGIPRSAAEEVLVLDYLEPRSLEIIRQLCPHLAAVLVEPIQSRYPAVQPGEFLKQLRDITAYSGTVLIFDEMITGFRIHPGGAQAYFNIQADICTYGKIVGGGLPIGVIAGKAMYLDHIDGGSWNYGDTSYPQVERTFFGGTFCQYHEAMASALAVLKYLEQQGPKLQEQLNQRTEIFAQTLNDYFDSHNINMRVSYFGSLFRFDIAGGLDLFYYHMLEKGVYIWEWRNCFLSTAHTDADLDHIIAAVKETV